MKKRTCVRQFETCPTHVAERHAATMVLYIMYVNGRWTHGNAETYVISKATGFSQRCKNSRISRSIEVTISDIYLRYSSPLNAPDSRFQIRPFHLGILTFSKSHNLLVYCNVHISRGPPRYTFRIFFYVYVPTTDVDMLLKFNLKSFLNFALSLCNFFLFYFLQLSERIRSVSTSTSPFPR